MRIHITLRHLEFSDETRSMIEDQIRHSFAHFENNRQMEVIFVVTTIAPRTDHHGPTYDCRIVVRAPWLARELFVHAEGGEFFETAHESIRMMHRQLAKLAQRNVRRRRHTQEDLYDEYLHRSTGT